MSDKNYSLICIYYSIQYSIVLIEIRNFKTSHKEEITDKKAILMLHQENKSKTWKIMILFEFCSNLWSKIQ